MNGKEADEIQTNTGMDPRQLASDSLHFRLWLMDHLLSDRQRHAECVAKIHAILADHEKRLISTEEAVASAKKIFVRVTVLAVLSAMAGGGVATTAKALLETLIK